MSCTCGIPICEHGPGPCLDACIAREVMGWQWDTIDSWRYRAKGHLFLLGERVDSWKPSLQWGCAGRVLERMSELNKLANIGRGNAGYPWSATIGSSYGEADQPSLAICRAALLEVRRG